MRRTSLVLWIAVATAMTACADRTPLAVALPVIADAAVQDAGPADYPPAGIAHGGSGFDDTSGPGGQPTVHGALDAQVVVRHVRRSFGRITYCYEHELRAKPGLEGALEARFVIEADGTVSSPTATGVDDAVASCVAAVIGRIQFPKPGGGGTVTVTYPFTFAPKAP